jgi:hypothetical protein
MAVSTGSSHTMVLYSQVHLWGAVCVHDLQLRQRSLPGQLDKQLCLAKGSEENLVVLFFGLAGTVRRPVDV